MLRRTVIARGRARGGARAQVTVFEYRVLKSRVRVARKRVSFFFVKIGSVYRVARLVTVRARAVLKHIYI